MNALANCASVGTRGLVKDASRRKGGGLRPSLTAAHAPSSGFQARTKKRPRSAEQRNITG